MKRKLIAVLPLLACAVPKLGWGATLNIPPNIVVPNYDRTLIGQIPSLEGGAFVARTDDPSANWYNPAGLINSKRTAVNTSASAYGWTALQASAAGSNIGAINGSDVPGFFGVVIGEPVFNTDQVRIGFSLSRELTWAPALQSQIIQDLGGGSIQRTNYSIRDNFNQYVPGFSIAYSFQEKLRLGTGFMVTSTSYQSNSSVSLQQLAPTSQTNQIRSSQVNANALNLRFSLGGQYDLSDHWKVGLFLRSPNLNLLGSSTVTFESLSNSSAQNTNTSFFDNDGTFRYNESFQTNIGLAYQNRYFELEGDLRYHATVGSYTLFSSSRTIDSTSSTAGGAPVTTSQPFSDVSNSFKSVVNFAGGGRYILNPSFSLHAGFYTSYSPVQDSSGASFRQIDLYGATTGLSVKIDNFSGSLGTAFEWGTSEPFTVTDLSTGNAVLTTVSIKSLKLLYSLSFKF
jgi:hypothetical protein